MTQRNEEKRGTSRTRERPRVGDEFGGAAHGLERADVPARHLFVEGHQRIERLGPGVRPNAQRHCKIGKKYRDFLRGRFLRVTQLTEADELTHPYK